MAGTPPAREAHRSRGLPHRRLIPVHPLERREPVRLSRLLPRGRVLLVDRPDLTFEGSPDGVPLERLAPTEAGNGTTALVAASLVESFEARDALIASGMESGVPAGYERLDEPPAVGVPA